MCVEYMSNRQTAASAAFSCRRGTNIAPRWLSLYFILHSTNTCGHRLYTHAHEYLHKHAALTFSTKGAYKISFHSGRFSARCFCTTLSVLVLSRNSAEGILMHMMCWVRNIRTKRKRVQPNQRWFGVHNWCFSYPTLIQRHVYTLWRHINVAENFKYIYRESTGGCVNILYLHSYKHTLIHGSRFFIARLTRPQWA